jgi:hypothetical protein
VPLALADTITITFSETVNVGASNLRVVGLYTANIPTLAEFTYDIGTITATWRFENWAPADQYVLSIADAVTDVDGNLLDGEWTNPLSVTTSNSMVSEFPSGDGDAGGDFNFVVTLLPADTNRDGYVTEGDFDVIYANWQLYSELIDWTWGDVDGNHGVDWDDVDFVLEYLGTDLHEVKILADLNGDLVVDDLDADILNDHYWAANPTYLDGDLNGDGDVTAEDIDLLFAQLGLELELVS